MNTKNKIIYGALGFSTIALLWAWVFAANVDNPWTTQKTKTWFARMHERFWSGENLRQNIWSMFWQFIDYSKLTDDQKSTLKTLNEKNAIEMKSLMDQLKSATTDEQKNSIKSQIDTLRKTHLESLKTYVSSDKLSDYEKFIENSDKMPTMWFGKWWRANWENWTWDFKAGWWFINQFVDTSKLSTEQKTQFESILSGQRSEMEKLSDEYQQKMSDLRKTHLESLKSYVSSDKLSDYEKFIENSSTQNWMKGFHKGRGGEWKWFGKMHWNNINQQTLEQIETTQN